MAAVARSVADGEELARVGSTGAELVVLFAVQSLKGRSSRSPGRRPVRLRKMYVAWSSSDGPAFVNGALGKSPAPPRRTGGRS